MAEAAIKLDIPGRIPISFQLGDRLIDSVRLKPMSYSGFVDCVNEAQGMTQPKTFEARLRRCRLHKQAEFFIGAAPTQVAMEDLLRLPIPVARTLISKLDENEPAAGKLIRKGDGIAEAIILELGTPVPVGQGKSPLKELEFIASTFGDVEDVLASPNRLQQALMLLQTIAKPLGTTLQQMPSWAVGQITIPDGFVVANEIVPLFLESPEES